MVAPLETRKLTKNYGPHISLIVGAPMLDLSISVTRLIQTSVACGLVEVVFLAIAYSLVRLVDFFDALLPCGPSD